MNSTTILVADDEPHIRHVVSAKLKNAGYDVLVAEDGREAYELAKANHPSLIVTDCQMPEMSGLELCGRLRSEADTADIPALILTARGFSLDAKDLEGTNIREVLAKPFSPRELLSKVQQHLNAASMPVAKA